MWKNGLEIKERNEVDCKAPSNFDQLSFEDARLYTLASLFMIAEEAKVHLKVYEDLS